MYLLFSQDSINLSTSETEGASPLQTTVCLRCPTWFERSELGQQQHFSHGNEKQCVLIHPGSKERKAACTELCAVTARPLLLPILMPFAICSSRLGHETEFLDRRKSRGAVISFSHFLLARSFGNLSMVPYTNFFYLEGAVWVDISLMFDCTAFTRGLHHSTPVLTLISLQEKAAAVSMQ